MNHLNIRPFVVWLSICGIVAVASPARAAEVNWESASKSAATAGHSLTKVHRWLHEIALPKIDPETGLYLARGLWNYRDTAADCYPFLTWAAWAVDEEVLNGPVRSILDAERRLCNVVDSIPAPYNLDAGKPQEISRDELVFQASEYVKDGLIAIVEVTGSDEWFDRMREIEDDIWRQADIESDFGVIPSDNVEVNGEQIQALARLYTMTGEPRYLDWAERLADYYLSDEDWVPQRLRDHGCEIIGGLGLLVAVETTHRPEKAARYQPRLKKMFDTILDQGLNPDGMMFNRMGGKGADGPYDDLSDGWGYNYVAYLCYDMAMGSTSYTEPVRNALGNLSKPVYTNYAWEGESIDGYADSIEGGIYLINREPVPEAVKWVDQETKNNLVDHPSRLENGDLWGTMKLQANGVRTVIMHALMHTQGVVARPWMRGMELGAAPHDEGIALVMTAPEDYRGRLEFDIPRHRVYMGFEKDWPRMNTLPEWFTVELDGVYEVQNLNEGASRTYTGRQLHNGLAVDVSGGEELRLVVKRK